ncbi:hypothetical protein CMV_020240 [Castanea mollissima]|uniref:Protein kinase domain-containing protein n=1 Tax=Castanea mollissima TaxID=60419 RepID=A0A8J4QWV7_9ROSI|nr:hypothetical protein CMV_020240 [Castanea mollissima]
MNNASRISLEFGIAMQRQAWPNPQSLPPVGKLDLAKIKCEPDHLTIPNGGTDVWEIDPNHLTKVQHKNVVQFIGACSKPPILCIITEYMSGGSVYDFLHKQKGVFKLPYLIRVAIDVSKGMDYLRKNNIIHRDLKAANLLMDVIEDVQVADFGVARVKTQSGVMTAETGTYRWMAPEVLEHKPYNHKADVFSFAIVLWELLTGKLPYEYLTPLQAAVGVVQKGLRPIIPEHTHPKLAELLEKCWRQDPALRPDFSEIIEILQQTAKEVGDKGEGRHKEKSSGGFLSVLRRGHH